MIPSLPGWLRKHSETGLLLYPRDDESAGTISYTERLRPVLPVRQLVAAFLAQHPQLRDPKPGQVVPLITAEGEYGALTSVATQLDDRPAQLDFGFVFGDDFYSQVCGLSTKPDQFARFRETVDTLTFRDAHMLGIRRRRFLYDPPRDWQGHQVGFLSNFFPTDYPDNAGSITVWPASPVNGESPRSLFAAMLAEDVANGFEQKELAGPDNITNPAGLSGCAWGITGRFNGGPLVFRDIAIFADDRFIYPLRLETLKAEQWPAHRRIFAEVVHSVQPIPRPNEAMKAGSGLLDLWS